MKVLIADDDSVSRALLARVVRRWGYEVILASDGSEALRILESDRTIQLCILDWMMPTLSGPEVCRALREWGEEPYIYTLLLTSRAETDDVVEGLRAGADDYLFKPCNMTELEFRLRSGVRVIELQRRLSEAKERLHQEATHDALTGALNRRAIFDQLTRELSRAERRREPVAAVLLDLDHFKQVNDTHGHQAGDAVLVETPHRIKSVLREYDTVGRYGGEEFLVVLSACDENHAQTVAERIRAAIASHPFVIPGGEIPVTASLGVATTIYPARTGREEMVRAADAALYRSKHGGRNQVQLAISEEFVAPSSTKRTGSAA